MASHRSHNNIATKEFSDIQLLYTEKYKTRFDAEKREKQLKGWSAAKKKALIQGNLKLLQQLSKAHEHVGGSLG